MRRCKRRNGDRGVCWRTTSTTNRIVSVTLEVLIPKSLDPLQKFKVISDVSQRDGTTIDLGGNALHLAFHEFFYGNGLQEC